jgi:hypothetical protein
MEFLVQLKLFRDKNSCLERDMLRNAKLQKFEFAAVMKICSEESKEMSILGGEEQKTRLASYSSASTICCDLRI